jgi:uncharacterized protein with HEPN domain
MMSATYLGVNLATIWRITQSDLPSLKDAVNDLLSEQ